MMAYQGFCIFISALLLDHCTCAKEQHFSFVLILYLLIRDREDKVIRVSLATVSICNGPLYTQEYSSHQAPGHSLAEEGYERARNPGLSKCVMTFRGRIWWLTPKKTDH